jgi:hypothetical protein
VLRDFASLLRQWAKASDRSMGRKKRILMAALKHSLRANPEEYDKGLGLAVLEALEGLDYGDILTLRRIALDTDDYEEMVREHGSGPAPPDLYDGDAWHAARLDLAGLVGGNAGAAKAELMHVTWFGRKVLEYVQNGFADVVAEEEREERKAQE